jgi:integrase
MTKMSTTPAISYGSQAWVNFVNLLDNKETLTGYTHDIRQYIGFLKLQDPAELLKGTAEQQENLAISFIMSLKGKRSVSRIRRIMAAVKAFYDINRVTLNWKFILRHVGKGKTLKDTGYSMDHIRKALAVASLRNKVLLLVYTSSGVRRAALPELRKRHLIPIDKYGIYKIVVYENDEEEYITYCTPECRAVIDEYLEYRARYGERITPESLLVRDEFNREDQFRAAKPQPLKASTISTTMIELFEKAGVRQRIKLTEGQTRFDVHQSIKGVHGLRKTWDTQMTLAGVQPLWVELLEGHRIKGMKSHYLRPTDEQLLEGSDRLYGYAHAIDYLTIDDSNRLKRANVKLTAEVNEIQSLKAQMEKQAEEMALYKKQAAQSDDAVMQIWSAMQRLGLDKKDAPTSGSRPT